MNTRNSGESALRTLDLVVNTSPPHPADQSGDEDTNSTRRRPLDWVFADFDLNQHQIPVQIGNNTFPNGLVFDSRTYNPLSDVAPVRRNDSGAPQMQHMAVIKDYAIPDDDELPAITSLASCQTITGFVNENEWQVYAINVPMDATELLVQLASRGGGGDVDIYVRQEEQPTLNLYDFRPWLNGSDEIVTVNNLSRPELDNGQWFISTHGYTSGGYSLTAVIDNEDCGR